MNTATKEEQIEALIDYKVNHIKEMKLEEITTNQVEFIADLLETIAECWDDTDLGYQVQSIIRFHIWEKSQREIEENPESC